jgi:ABC-type phosphate/phosphonate transport system substrate-binding protein
MAMVLRLNEEQEKKLEELMKEVGEATKSKAIIYMIENSKEILRNNKVYKEIVRLEEEIKETEKKIAKLKK